MRKQSTPTFELRTRDNPRPRRVTFESIESAMRKGKNTYAQIAEEIGVHYTAVLLFVKREGYENLQDFAETRGIDFVVTPRATVSIDAIESAMRQGHNSTAKIAKSLGVSTAILEYSLGREGFENYRDLAERRGIELPSTGSKRRTPLISMEAVEAAMLKGKNTYVQIAEEIGMGYSTVVSFVNRKGYDSLQELAEDRGLPYTPPNRSRTPRSNPNFKWFGIQNPAENKGNLGEYEPHEYANQQEGSDNGLRRGVFAQGMNNELEKRTAKRRRYKAVIITGNPYYLNGEKGENYRRYYNEIKQYLHKAGYDDVVFDPGAEHTTPPLADLWVGHSRGAGRLRFAPEGTLTLDITRYEDGIEEYKALMVKEMEKRGYKSLQDFPVHLRPVPGAEHYTLTQRAKDAIWAHRVNEFEKLRGYQEDFEEYEPHENPFVYHGGNVDVQRLEPIWMAHEDANQQEGVGIYFTTNLETAMRYGPQIIEAYVDLDTFVPSRDLIGEHFTQSQIANLLYEMGRKAPLEDMYYKITDYFEYPCKRLSPRAAQRLAEFFMNSEIRHFQNEIAKVDTEAFVEAWNEVLGVNGTYHHVTEDETFIAVINPEIQVKTKH